MELIDSLFTVLLIISFLFILVGFWLAALLAFGTAVALCFLSRET